MKRVLIFLVFGALVVLAGVPARAQYDTRESIALNNQIAELRRDVQELRDQLARGGGGAPSGGGYSSLGGYRAAPAAGPGGGSDLTGQLLQRVSQLEDEVRRLHGRVDEADNARERQGEDLKKQIGDLNFKLDGMAGGGGGGGKPQGGAPPVLAPPVVPAAPAAPAVPGHRTADMALQEGSAALARRDYAAAETAAREVLTGPQTARSADANFLLAQSLAGRREWARAAVAYDDTYSRAKTGARAPDALIGLAVSLTNLNEKISACQTLDKLRVQFPNPRPDLREPIATARLHAGCH